MTNSDPSSVQKDYWKKIDQEAPILAITKCEEAAKQLITLTSLITTIYTGVISFSDIIKQPMALRPILLLIMLPLPFWLTSLFLATRVIVPRAYPAKQIEDDYIKISRVKYHYLQWSYAILIVSMIVLVVAIGIYLLVVPPPPP